jgi:uncharacterized alpha-E superfamily protein
VLSRIAESLFWLGRYIERAEDTARILDVQYHLLLEDPWANEETTCRALLDVMGLGGRVAEPDAESVTHLLAFDDSYTGSIAGGIGAAWKNARSVREAISLELWESLNSTWLALPTQAQRTSRRAPHLFFGWVKERCAVFAGLADSTMSRDDGWRFLVLGRSLERVDMTARMLSLRFADGDGHSGWATTLSCCSAYEAYLRTYQRAVDASLAAEFLLLDRLFPRSVFAALRTAEQCLAELAPESGRTGLDDEARRALGRARTTLEFHTVDELLSDLPGHLARVRALCAEAAGAVADRSFHQARPVQWTA